MISFSPLFPLCWTLSSYPETLYFSVDHLALEFFFNPYHNPKLDMGFCSHSLARYSLYLVRPLQNPKDWALLSYSSA